MPFRSRYPIQHFHRGLAASLAFAAMGLMATTALAMTSGEHQAAKEQIAVEHKAAKQQCDALSGNPKDICVKQAKGHEEVARAELEAQYRPSDKSHFQLAKARADARYAVAKEQCDDLSGNPKDVCVKDAKAAHVAALENAKVMQAAAKPARTEAEKGAQVAEARKDAAAEKNEANYQAAKERCDTLAGDLHSKCVDDAKRMHGQK